MPRLALIAGLLLAGLFLIASIHIRELHRNAELCASDGMSLVDTSAGYRCRDPKSGELFLTPFPPEKSHR